MTDPLRIERTHAPTLRLGACLALAVAVVACLSCSTTGSAGGKQQNSRAVLGAAISLAEPLEAAIETYRSAHPGKVPSLHLAGSTRLAQQLRHGAPMGWIISAGVQELDALEAEAHIVSASRRAIAENQLCWASRQPLDPAFDWARVERLALGNPLTCPLGRYSEQALRDLQLWQQLEPRMLLGENARQTLEYVLRGEAAFGVVYCSEDERYPDRGLVLTPILDAEHEPIAYQAAQVTNASNPDLDKFMHWLLRQDDSFWRAHGLNAP